MAAVAFDTLEYAQQLEAAGMPRAQAEVVAKGLSAMFVHNFDALVTKDYLDTRFAEFETRIESRMDRRFAQVDLRFERLESRMNTRMTRIEITQAIILAALVIPVLQALLVWWG